MNYIGSKLRLSSWILQEVKKVVGDDLKEKVFCDMFAGTGVVGRAFKTEVKQVMSNDMEHYSYVLNQNYIGNHKRIPDAEKYIHALNNLPLREDGFIYQHYCLGSGSGRQYFSDENGKKIDTIRHAIEGHKEDKELFYFLLASLLESADKVANTASIYGSFLKHLKKTASKTLILESATFPESINSHKVFNQDSKSLIQEISGDILYLDPPYNQRQYSANYHLLNTISRYDSFTPKGVAGLREYHRSDYSRKKVVHHSFEALIKNAHFKYIFLSYNNEGLMHEDEVRSIMKKYGDYHLVKKEYKRFRADKIESRKHKGDKTFEYLHILIKAL